MTIEDCVESDHTYILYFVNCDPVFGEIQSCDFNGMPVVFFWLITDWFAKEEDLKHLCAP